MNYNNVFNKGDFFKDSDGNMYQIIAIAREHKTLQEVIVYQALYDSFECYTITFEEFFDEKNKKNSKFKLIDTKELRKSDDIHSEDSNKTISQDSSKEDTVEKQDMEADTMMLTKDVNNKKSKQIRQGRTKEELLKFLEADYYKDKLEIINYMKRSNLLTESILTDMAFSIDCVIEGNTLDEQYNSVVKCLKILGRYQSRRFRKPEIFIK